MRLFSYVGYETRASTSPVLGFMAIATPFDERILLRYVFQKLISLINAVFAAFCSRTSIVNFKLLPEWHQLVL